MISKNAIPQKGSEVNLTLGGIDLNSSGSVAIKADKKLLTVLFPDGRDGRAFTLKAETSEDLHEWKDALEEALANAPSAALVMGKNGLFKNEQADAADAKDRQPVKSFVIGRPILLALEDIDGTSSFLEKALKFLEEHGEILFITILKMLMMLKAAYENMNRYVLRELPSSPVPASCCNAFTRSISYLDDRTELSEDLANGYDNEANVWHHRTDRSMRVSAMRAAICETFPEPNRRLLQRVLMMMQTVASHKAENRMSTSAVAVCMAPLLLRPPSGWRL
ncbi:hypothetical protein RJ639_031433 [Escallonia herrerae]|uniref:Uncharacterized protein n=1 Tax=Escallonia herrerae TaxID=1293975 RepID=A0AA88X1U0_9ASTE|nr:hypothetical protein RJ639_031433 [Escallonia herrerae]